ncbi:hypothetical protein H6F53_15835, partial [Trichocoleus sp. FACHB-832]|uniref:DNA primase family protein n=1 Tax=Trichocoleus sp. FACHB-832 TaxID=2692875 RepID=UPI0018EFD1BA
AMAAIKADESTNAKGLLFVEGEECVEELRSVGIAGITNKGSAWTEAALVAQAKTLKEADPNAVLIYLKDNDDIGSTKAQKVFDSCTKVGLACIVIDPLAIYPGLPEKGDVVDILKVMDSAEFIRKLEEEIHRAVEERRNQEAKAKAESKERSKERKEEKKAKKSVSEGKFAALIAATHCSVLAWHVHTKKWYQYSRKQEGIWAETAEEFVSGIVTKEADKLLGFGQYSSSYINGTVRLLKAHLAVDTWDEMEGLLPLENGVLNLSTNELTSHTPDNRFTWCVPYCYNPLATCNPIQEWLMEALDGDAQVVQLIRGYLNAIVKGRTDLQRYLELIGPGGTGKSTLIRLAEALIGSQNTHSTTLQKLENSRYETACLYKIRLAVITDSERYSGGVSTLKALTGQDKLPYEVKFQQPTRGFTPNAMTIVAANEPIQSGDYTSGLERRRITVLFQKQIPPDQQRNLIEVQNGKLIGEFVEYIPGLLNWVLAMSDEEVTNFVKRTSTYVPSLSRAKSQSLVETNPIAAWTDHSLVYRKGTRTHVGTAKRDKDPSSDNTYQNVQTWLYANYCEYSVATGTKPVGLQRFVNLLKDLFKNQLRLDINHDKDRVGAHFTNLKIRTEHDQEPPIITGNRKPDSPPPNRPSPDSPPSGSLPPNPPSPDSPPPSPSSPSSKSTAAVMDCDGSVMDAAMDETLASDGCDGCDGLFENSNSREIFDAKTFDAKTGVWSDDSEPTKKTYKEETFGESPSHPSQSIATNGLNHHNIHHTSITHPSHDEVSPAEISEIAQMLSIAPNGNMVMAVMAIFCNQNPEARKQIWSSIAPAEQERLLGMKSEAQDKAQPGNKCKVRLNRQNRYEWVDAKFIAAKLDPDTLVWTFELADGQRQDVVLRNDWLLLELDDAGVVAEIDQVEEISKIDCPWEETTKNDSLTSEEKKND